MTATPPPGMIAASSYLIETKEAQSAADLGSIERDLELVASGAQELSQFTDDETFSRQRTAFIDSVVIRYRRCFSSGLRLKLTRMDVLRVAPQYSDIHDFFHDLGNKHIAHSVSALEQSVPMVQVDETDPEAWKIVAHALLHLEGSVETSNLIRLGELAKILQERHVVPERDRFAKLFEAQVAAFTHQRLKKLKPAMLPVNLGVAEIGKRRWRPPGA